MTDSAAQERFSYGLRLLWLLAAPLWVSGAVRTVTSLSLGVSLELALVATVPLGALLAWRARRGQLTHEVTAFGISALLFAGCFLALYNDDFYGAPMFSGIPDAAHHLQNRHAFIGGTPQIYAGCVTQYAFASWVVSLFKVNELWGFNASFYFTVAAWCMAVGGALGQLLARAEKRRWALMGLAVAGALLFTVALPQFHYYSAEGFYPQLFALVPLLALWMVDATVRRPPLWLVGILVLAALERYSYGLHLTELFFALAVIAAMEAVRAGTWRSRALYALATLGFVGLVVKAFLAVRALYGLVGPFLPLTTRPLLVGMWLLLAAVGAAQLWLRDAVGRWLRLPLLMALPIIAFVTVAPMPPRGQDYYYYKLTFHALLLLCAAAVIAAVAAAGWLRRASFGILALLAGSAFAFHRAGELWRPAFYERTFRQRPYQLLKPLSDERAMRRIERILGRERRAFGGYLTSWYPTMDFANSTYDYVNGEIAFYYGWPPREQPGYCVFWEWCEKPEQCLDTFFPQRGRLEGYMKEPARNRCETYAPRWNPQGSRTLCWRCY